MAYKLSIDERVERAIWLYNNIHFSLPTLLEALSQIDLDSISE